MGELTIQLDEAVLAELSRLAAAHGRLAEEEVASVVTALFGAGRPVSSEKAVWLAESARLRAETGRLGVSMTDLIREGRDER